jgi:hypothetical protein
MDGIDDELRRVLARHGGGDLAAYLALPDVYLHGDAPPLPRGTMDARAFLDALDAVEAELRAREDARARSERHLSEALAHAASLGVHVANDALARAFEARWRALQTRRVRLVTRHRPIDAMAFRAAMAPLLATRLEALAALGRTRAGNVMQKRMGPYKEPVKEA